MFHALFIRQTSIILSFLDLRLPRQCKRDIRSSLMLRSVNWLIYRHFGIPFDGVTEALSRNVGNYLQI